MHKRYSQNSHSESKHARQGKERRITKCIRDRSVLLEPIETEKLLFPISLYFHRVRRTLGYNYFNINNNNKNSDNNDYDYAYDLNMYCLKTRGFVLLGLKTRGEA